MRALFWNDSGQWWLNFSEVKFDILICWLCTAAALTIYVSCPLILYANTTLNMAMRWIKCVVNENTQLQCGKLNYCEKPFIYTDLLLSEIYLFPWLYWCIFFLLSKNLWSIEFITHSFDQLRLSHQINKLKAQVDHRQCQVSWLSAVSRPIVNDRTKYVINTSTIGVEQDKVSMLTYDLRTAIKIVKER